MSLPTFWRKFLYMQRNREREEEFFFPTSQPQEVGWDEGAELDIAHSIGHGSGCRDAGTLACCEIAMQVSVQGWSGPPCCCLIQHNVLPTAVISGSTECFHKKLAVFYLMRGPLAPTGLLRLGLFFHLPWSSSQLLWHSLSVSLNSACTFSLLSSEIRVSAHPLEQLQPSVKGGPVLICSAAVPRDSLQQTWPCRFPYSLAFHQGSVYPSVVH